MRILLAVTPALALTACGSGDDFSVDVAASPQKVQASLGNLHSSSVPSVLSLKPAQKSTPAGGQILYTVPAKGKYDDATILLQISDIGDGKSRVTVNADVPAVTMQEGGQEKYISESKFERYLEKDLRSWARKIGKGETASSEVGEISQSIGALAVAIQYEGNLSKLANGELPAGVNWSAFGDDNGYGDSDFASSDYEASDYEIANARPSLDPSEDAASYGQPMDDAEIGYDSYDDGGGWGNDAG